MISGRIITCLLFGAMCAGIAWTYTQLDLAIIICLTILAVLFLVLNVAYGND